MDLNNKRPNTMPEYTTISKPNTNFRSRTQPINGIVIHSMGELIGQQPADEFLQQYGLSAHYLIEENGTVIECVNVNNVAYHAGVSRWNEKSNLNETFIGIEVLLRGAHTYETFIKGINKPTAYTSNQYLSTAKLCNELISSYNIPLSNVVRHSDISGDHVRGKGKGKLDPGDGFQWDFFKSLL